MMIGEEVGAPMTAEQTHERTKYRIRGEVQEDSGLFSWMLLSLVRGLFFYANASLTGKYRAVNAVAVYYSLFHLGMFLVFGCPKYQDETLRRKIQKKIDQGEDASRALNHRDVLRFAAERSPNGLPARVGYAIGRTKLLREFINYGPRMYSDVDFARFDSCQFQTDELESLRGQLALVFGEAVAWAYAEGDDEGIWVLTAIQKAKDFFGDAKELYAGWCGAEEAVVAEALRASLEEQVRTLVHS
jgi:hypothetical protein